MRRSRVARSVVSIADSSNEPNAEADESSPSVRSILHVVSADCHMVTKQNGVRVAAD